MPWISFSRFILRVLTTLCKSTSLIFGEVFISFMYWYTESTLFAKASSLA